MTAAYVDEGACRRSAIASFRRAVDRTTTGPAITPSSRWRQPTPAVYALMEDNLKREFALGLHLHRQHAETFYILDGVVNFHIDGDWMAAEPGACVHIPPGVPHALDLPTGGTARCLMIFQPAGFDQFLAELSALSEAQMAEKTLMDALNHKYDIINLGGVPPRP